MTDTTLAEATDAQLLDELRSRNLVLSVWSVEDFKSAIVEDEDDGAVEALTEDDVEGIALAMLHRSGKHLEDVLGTRGNEFISDTWSDVRGELLVSADAPKA